MKHVSNHPCFPLWPLIFNLGGQLGYSIYSLTVYLRCTYTDGHCKATRGGVAYGVRCSQSGGNTAHPSFHSHRPPTHLPPACSATYDAVVVSPKQHSPCPSEAVDPLALPPILLHLTPYTTPLRVGAQYPFASHQHGVAERFRDRCSTWTTIAVYVHVLHGISSLLPSPFYSRCRHGIGSASGQLKNGSVGGGADKTDRSAGHRGRAPHCAADIRDSGLF